MLQVFKRTFSKIKIIKLNEGLPVVQDYVINKEEPRKERQIKLFGQANVANIMHGFEAVAENPKKHKGYFSDECRIYVQGGNGGKGSYSFERGMVFGQSL